MISSGTLRARAAIAAYFASAANLAAGATMVFLRPGIAAGASSLSARIAYVANHTSAWRIGWVVWHLAAIALIAFLVGLALLWQERAPIASAVAIVAAAAGLAADLSAEAILAGAVPGLSPPDFAVLERTALVLTGYLGNGLYVVAGITLMLIGRREIPRGLLWLGAAVWASGLWLSAASLVDSSTGQLVSTAALVPLFVVWAALMGRWLSIPGS